MHLSHAVTRFLGDMLYDLFVSINILIKGIRRLLRLPYWSLAAHVHSSVRIQLGLGSTLSEAYLAKQRSAAE